MTTAKRARRTAKRRRQAARRGITRQRATAGSSRAPATRPTYGLVAGERPEQVLEGLVAIGESSRVEHCADGIDRVQFDLAVGSPDLTMGPVRRALMRVEAELILQEADAFTTLAGVRPDEERRGDALLLLTRRVCEAISLPAAS